MEFACCSGSFLSELFVIKTSNLCLCLNQEEMARAQVLILHGHQLAANHHYALALIIQRCNELRHYCDVITIAIRTKRASLTRTRDLLGCLEEVKMFTGHSHMCRNAKMCAYKLK